VSGFNDSDKAQESAMDLQNAKKTPGFHPFNGFDFRNEMLAM